MIQYMISATSVIFRLPFFIIAQPAKGMMLTAPMESPNRTSPIVPLSAEYNSCIRGSRDTQFASINPFVKNAILTAMRFRSSVRDMFSFKAIWWSYEDHLNESLKQKHISWNNLIVMRINRKACRVASGKSIGSHAFHHNAEVARLIGSIELQLQWTISICDSSRIPIQKRALIRHTALALLLTFIPRQVELPL